MSDEGFSVEPVSDALHPRVQGDLFLPSHPSGWGVLVLAGSSGRLDVHGARLLARGRPSWTFGGKGVPFVPYDLAGWEQPREGLIEYRELYQLILVAGAADALWLSDAFARSIAQRLRDHGRTCTL
jgi:hypothetical protein